MPAQTLVAAIADREAEVNRLDATLAELAEPLHHRWAVSPAWVRHQLTDLVTLLSETPERTKTEFRRLALSVTMQPIRDPGLRPFYRAVGTAALPCLAGTRDFSVPTVDRLDPQSAGSRTGDALAFVVQLPCNQLGPDWRKRA